MDVSGWLRRGEWCPDEDNTYADSTCMEELGFLFSFLETGLESMWLGLKLLMRWVRRYRVVS